MTLKVTVRVDKLLKLQASIQNRTVDEVRNNAEYMRDYAAAIAPRDTGAFATSLYINGPGEESDYGQRSAAARALNPQAHIVPEIQAATPDAGSGQLRSNLGQFAQPEAIVAPAVEYGLFLEEGTRYMAPRPTLRPAAEATRERFVGGMKHVADV